MDAFGGSSSVAMEPAKPSRLETRFEDVFIQPLAAARMNESRSATGASLTFCDIAPSIAVEFAEQFSRTLCPALDRRAFYS